MVKLKGPLLSLKASKQLAKTLIFKNYGNRNVLTGYSKPGSKNPFTRSTSQTQIRVRYGEAVEAWNKLSPVEQESYNENAKGERYSGYNLFMQEYSTLHPLTSDLAYYGLRTHGIFIYAKT